jgi:hypothetical protein
LTLINTTFKLQKLFNITTFFHLIDNLSNSGLTLQGWFTTIDIGYYHAGNYASEENVVTLNSAAIPGFSG